MDERVCIILDFVNCENIDDFIKKGGKFFVGGNCLIILSLMGFVGLIKVDFIEWMSVMIYQLVLGVGVKYVCELIV